MLYFVLGIYILIIFPIFTSFNITFIKKYKKLYWTINIFGLSIIGGLINLNTKGVVIKIGKKKTILYPYRKILNIKNRTKTLKDFHIISFRSLVEYGNTNNIELANVLFNVYVWHNNIIGKIFSNLKPYLKLKNDVDIYEKQNLLNVYLQVKILFNVLTLLIIFIKIFKEKISNAAKR